MAAGIYRHDFTYSADVTLMLMPAEHGCRTCYDSDSKHAMRWYRGEEWRSRWSADRKRIYIDWVHRDGKVRRGDDNDFFIDVKTGELEYGVELYPVAPRDYRSFAFTCGGEGMPEPAN